MIWETWIAVAVFLLCGSVLNGQAARNSQMLRTLRLIRVARIARTARFVQYFPELLTLTHALGHGLRAVLSVGVLLTLALYVFGIVFTMGLADDALFQDRF